MTIPFLCFDYMHGLLREEAIKTFTQFYDDQRYILDEGVKQFENEYAFFCTTKFCVGISNGLDALYIALKILKVDKGDEVIVPSNTYIATVLAVSYTGAVPVFAEPDIITYNLDPNNLEAAITNRTKIIIPVHLYGQACEMDKILNIASKHHLHVVEDNAQAHGAMYNQRVTGSFGDINATSFYPTKNLGALGDAGAITTNNEDYAQQAKLLRNYGSSKKYYNETIGYNKRLDELQARFLSLKLRHFELFTQLRLRIAEWYNNALQDVSEITLPQKAKGATHVYHQYVIRTKNRNALQEYLQKKGIFTLIHYPIPPHLQKAYANLNLKKGQFPLAEEIANNCLSLPIWPGLTRDKVEYISENIKDFFSRGRITA